MGIPVNKENSSLSLSRPSTVGQWNWPGWEGVTADASSIPLASGRDKIAGSIDGYDKINSGLPAGGLHLLAKDYTFSGYRATDPSQPRIGVSPRYQAGRCADGWVYPVNLRTAEVLPSKDGGSAVLAAGIQHVRLSDIPGAEEVRDLWRSPAPQSRKAYFQTIWKNAIPVAVSLTQVEENCSARYDSRRVVERKCQNQPVRLTRTPSGVMVAVDTSPERLGRNLYPIDRHHANADGFVGTLGSDGHTTRKTLVTPIGEDHPACFIHGVDAPLPELPASMGLSQDQAQWLRDHVRLKRMAFVDARDVSDSGALAPDARVYHRYVHVMVDCWTDNSTMKADELFALVSLTRKLGSDQMGAAGRPREAGKAPIITNCIFGHGRTGTFNVAVAIADLVEGCAKSPERQQNLARLDADALKTQVNRLVYAYRANTMAGAVAHNARTSQVGLLHELALLCKSRACVSGNC